LSVNTRADKLFPALTARERAVLVLRAWKEGGREDRQVRATMPLGQAAEFNRYIDLMNAANEGLGRYLVVLRAQAGQLGLIDGWLATIKLWSIHSFALGTFIFRFCPEPITSSDYERLKRSSRRREPRPDRGLKYEVFPDAEADHVERVAGERAHVMDMLGNAPFGDFQIPEKAEPPKIELAYQALIDRLKRQLTEYWPQLRSVETLLVEAEGQFGEDAAIPEVRAIVVWLREELTALHGKLKTEYLQEHELPEPSGEDLDTMRKISGWPTRMPGAGLTMNVNVSD
jgi:hypothetical protein